MIVADASVLIAHFDSSDRHHSRAADLLSKFAGSPLNASVVTLADVLVEPVRRGLADEARRAIRTLGVHEVPLAAGAASRLAVMRAEKRLRMPDCCVLLAAENVGAAAVLTFDQRLARTARELGFDVP